DDYTNAGALFIGSATPVSLGDYMAGSNHVLPTGGQSRYASGLGAYTFLRPQQVVEYDRDALAVVADRIVALAESESLPAHGVAITARFKSSRRGHRIGWRGYALPVLSPPRLARYRLPHLRRRPRDPSSSAVPQVQRPLLDRGDGE